LTHSTWCIGDRLVHTHTHSTDERGFRKGLPMRVLSPPRNRLRCVSVTLNACLKNSTSCPGNARHISGNGFLISMSKDPGFCQGEGMVWHDPGLPKPILACHGLPKLILTYPVLPKPILVCPHRTFIPQDPQAFPLNKRWTESVLYSIHLEIHNPR
jgi:hypothetical protein